MKLQNQYFVQGAEANHMDLLFEDLDGKWWMTTNEVAGTKSIMSLGLIRIKEIPKAEALQIIKDKG